MKRVLIISPHFPPVNAADMHRVRQSLPYFREFGWEPVTVCVEPHYVEGYTDDLLLETIPDDLQVERVSAFDYRWTRKLGLGSLALRSLLQIGNRGNDVLRSGKFDLVYFSTTAFAVFALGPYWKRKFRIPFVVDLQDPWYNDYYESRPRSERPPKYWFSHRLDGILEPRVMTKADGIVAVTKAYIDEMRLRYPPVAHVPSIELPFAVSPRDVEVARTLLNGRVAPRSNAVIGTYTGVCNSAMQPVLRVLLQALRLGLDAHPDLFDRVRLEFVGTSYAPSGRAGPAVLPIAREVGVEGYVAEQTDRVSYFEALRLQLESDFLLLPGTLDADYTASKLYPYVLAGKPILGLINARSSAVDILRDLNVDGVSTFEAESDLANMADRVMRQWRDMLRALPYAPDVDWTEFERFTAREMTKRQTELFEVAVARHQDVNA